MAYKAFLDINILVDFIDKERNEHNNAVLLFQAMVEGKLTGYISESVINTAYYITKKLISLTQFSQFLNDVLQLLKVLASSNAILPERLSLQKMISKMQSYIKSR